VTDLNTEYRYNIDKKLMRITFKDGDDTLFYIHYNDSAILMQAHPEAVIVNPTWGTNHDIDEWFNHVLSYQVRLGLVEGSVRPGNSRTLESDSTGITGTFLVNDETVADYAWVAATDTLTIAERVQDITNVSVACFKLYVQWLSDFKYYVDHFGE